MLFSVLFWVAGFIVPSSRKLVVVLIRFCCRSRQRRYPSTSSALRSDSYSTYAARLSAGGVADEWVTQLLRQSDAKVFKKYSQMKLPMKREALQRMNRRASEERGLDTIRPV